MPLFPPPHAHTDSAAGPGHLALHEALVGYGAQSKSGRGMKLLKVGKVGPTSLENKLESFHCAQVCTQDVTDS